MINRLNTSSSTFDAELKALLTYPEDNTAAVRQTVSDILADVRQRGDVAVLELTERFDRVTSESVADLEVPAEELAAAAARIDPLILDALKASVSRVTRYHEHQKQALGAGNWSYEDEFGNELGQRVTGMQKVGIYAPGGKAAYPSTVIMTAIPARVAGVLELTLTVPTPDGQVNDLLLAAAYLCGIDHVYRIGGAQAIAAMAYGTATIAAVDKIVGPGNIYVATAKEMVFGHVGIDMIAGPSEVVIVADAGANPEWLVMDMFAQAEHDEMAQSILVSQDGEFLDRVADKIDELLGARERKAIIETSLRDRGALIQVATTEDAASVVNQIAPEHLELAVTEPEALLDQIKYAGAVFVGQHTAEVMGDYTAGPSHVLPTSGAARFSSPLGIYDFQTRSSIVKCSPRGSHHLARDAAIIAVEEGLEAHAESARLRVEG